MRRIACTALWRTACKSARASRNVPTTETTDLATWERAEARRSLNEAVETTLGPTSADTFARYRQPAAETAYPLEYAFHLVGDIAGQRVLDIGCGSGGNSSLLAARGASVFALDISPDLLALAAQRGRLDHVDGAIAPLCASTHAIPLPDASVDLVFGNAILHHVDLERTAQEIARVLRPGGRAIFKEPVRDSRLVAWGRRLVPLHRDPISSYERPLRQAEIDAFSARFRQGRRRRFWLPFVSLARMTRWRDRARSRIYEWDGALLKRWPRLGHFASVTVFEVTR
jgi:SAM-dependent methyltransferase